MPELFYMIFCILFIMAALGVVLFLRFTASIRGYANKAFIAAAIYYVVERLKK